MPTRSLDIAQIVYKHSVKFENIVTERIQAGYIIQPPLKKATIKAKGASKRLIGKTGALLGAIKTNQYIKGLELGCVIGIFDPEVWYAVVHEYGFPADETTTKYSEDQIIPTRSWLRVPFDENFERISREMMADIEKNIDKKFMEGA